MNTLINITLSLTLLSSSACAGRAWQPTTADQKEPPAEASADTANTVARFQERDPSLTKYFEEAYGVAVFPTVGKGAWVVGGAYGKGEVYEGSKLVGSTNLTQLSVGFALGGQAYSEVIFFKDKAALEHFKSGNFEFGAQASAVAVTAGASAETSYDSGIAVFTLATGGLMYEAALAGQKFGYASL